MSEEKKKQLKNMEEGIDAQLSRLHELLSEATDDDALEYDFESLGMLGAVPPKELSEEEEGEIDDDPRKRLERIHEKREEKKKLKKELFVKRSVRRIRKDQNVHLVFLCDCTGSMRPSIEQCKEKVKDITKMVKNSFANFKMEVAFVGYRDYSVKRGGKRFEVLDFTTDEEVFKFLASVKPIGNKDIAEDVFGGLEKALDLSYDQNHPTRILVHMADAPPHGRMYHDKKHKKEISDRHPEGDPDKRDINKMLTSLSDKRIHYFFVAVPHKGKDLTRVMCEKFRPIYEKEDMEFTVFQHTEDYLKLFVKAISNSISKSHKVSEKEVNEEINKEMKDALRSVLKKK